MKKIIRINNLCLISVLICWIISSSFTNKPDAIKTPGEMKIKSKWVKEHLLSTDPILPFSFIYDEKSSSELLKTWQKKTEINKLDENRMDIHPAADRLLLNLVKYAQEQSLQKKP